MTDNKTHSALFELQKNLEDLVSAKMQMEEFRSASKNVVQGIGNVQQNFVKHLSDLETDYKVRIDKLEQSSSSFLASSKEENKTTIQKIASTTEQAISKGVEQFSSVANKVESSNAEKIAAITKLLEHYKNVVEASRSLIDSLTAIDFPSKLDAISTKTQLVIESINNAKQALELKSNENHTSIVDKTTTAKEQINQNTDTKFQSLSEQLNSTKETLNKTLQDNFSQNSQRQDKQDREIKLLKQIAIGIGILIIAATILTILILKKP